MSNATLTVSGTIAGDSVPLDQVATFDGISGTIYISVQVTSSTTINLNNIVIDIAKQTTYSVDISVENSSYIIPLYIRIDDGEEIFLDLGESITLNGSVLSMSITSFSNLNSANYNLFNEIELYAPGAPGVYTIYLNDDELSAGVGSADITSDGVWTVSNDNDGNLYLTDDGRVLNYVLTQDCFIYYGNRTL